MDHRNEYLVTGLMSGTSLDGLDIALCRFEKKNIGWEYGVLNAETVPYPAEWKDRLTGLTSATAEELAATHSDFGHWCGKYVHDFHQRIGRKPGFIASHGHTVFHQPHRKLTLQIGSGPAIAAETGLPVVFDFRSGDVALGGQGAPLVPIGDALLFNKYTSCLNIGGFANISFDLEGKRIAFDVCPANIVLNYLAGMTGHSYDPGGRMAAAGTVDADLFAALNALPYYGQPHPKSLGKEWTDAYVIPLLNTEKTSLNDLLATFCEHIAIQVARTCRAGEGTSMLVTGGGAFNDYLMARIRHHAATNVVVPDDLTVGFKEALIFAFLGVLRMRGEVNCLRSVTGASSDSCGGSVCLPTSGGIQDVICDLTSLRCVMTYRQTLDYLYACLPMYHRVGAQAYKADLDTTIALCAILRNPQHAFATVHVAGTNGKGSVSHMIASILQEAGYKTGLYTSPHLKDFRERIRVNGKMIGKTEVVDFIRDYRDLYEPLQPSFFELTVGMAFDHFRREAVDIAVIEVGLGGRLDSTNVITPEVSVITNISFDHMHLLGDTLPKIAAEKAGIIKPGVPVVIGETQPEVRDVFTERASALKTKLLFADSIFSVVNESRSGSHVDRLQLDLLREGEAWIKGIVSPLAGDYQRNNIVTVAAACETLANKGYLITPERIRKGIRNVVKNTKLAGRWQVLSRNPLTICDTGHNEGGLRWVLAQIAATPHRHLHFVFGVVNDKDLAPILLMLPSDACYYFCKPDIPRGLDAAILQGQADDQGLKGSIYPSVKEALAAAQKNAEDEDLVFVGGSTFVVAEVV